MNKTLEDVKKVFESTALFKVLFALGIIIVLLVVFSLGVAVGAHKASRMPHGTLGKITKIELPDIVILERGGMERAAEVDSGTRIDQAGRSLAPTDLTVGSFVILVGMPDETGVIRAKLIRVIPGNQPPEFLR